MNDTIGIAIAHRKIGEALNELGKYESAIKHQHKYLGKHLTVLTKIVINMYCQFDQNPLHIL